MYASKQAKERLEYQLKKYLSCLLCLACYKRMLHDLHNRLLSINIHGWWQASIGILKK